MNKARKVLLIFGMLSLIVLACNPPGGTSLSEIDEQATSVAETVEAQLSGSDVPDETSSSDAPGEGTLTATHTQEPSQTPQPTGTTPPTNTPPPTVTSVPCNRASFVSDVTYPDGSEITINSSFVKTWRLQNTGSCTWTSGYKLIFSNGDRMSAPDEVQLTGGTVAPGQTVDVSVNLTAPDTAGTYKGYFKLKSSDGAVFGIGASGTNPFWTEIKAVPLTFIITPLVITPLVIVTPEANVVYDGQRTCGGKYYLSFRVTNTGSMDIESYQITTNNMTAGVTTNNSSNIFGTINGCLSLAQPKIEDGDSFYITSGAFDFQLIGSNVTATIKLYPLDDQTGFYTEKTLSFIE